MKTILIIEDEEPLRLLIGELLQRAGYKVLPASSGRQGLRLACRADRHRSRRGRLGLRSGRPPGLRLTQVQPDVTSPAPPGAAWR